MAKRQYLETSAVVSECGRYRYSLRRRWRPGPTCVFVMLNPSVADANADDATIRRCVGFADDLGCGEIVVVNLFAFISTDPAGLWKVGAPVGLFNDQYIRDACCDASCRPGSTVILAWGTNRARKLLNREQAVLDLLRVYGIAPTALRVTKSGAPEHPVRLPKSCRPQPYQVAA